MTLRTIFPRQYYAEAGKNVSVPQKRCPTWHQSAVIRVEVTKTSWREHSEQLYILVPRSRHERITRTNAEDDGEMAGLVQGPWRKGTLEGHRASAGALRQGSQGHTEKRDGRAICRSERCRRRLQPNPGSGSESRRGALQNLSDSRSWRLG